TGVSAEDVDSKIRMVEARATMRVAFVKSGLPDAACKRLTAQFEGMDHFTEADVTAAINGEREYLASFTESGHVQGLGDSIEPGEDRSEKMSKMFDAFFNPDDRSVISFKECYVDFTGDTRVTGHLQNCNLTRMREAVGDIAFRESVSSGTFSNALGDAINRAVSGYYAKPGKYDDWRDLADVVPVSDFRTQERARVGGYGDLPVVAERGPYGALATPTDDISNYAVVKHGGTEDVSLEAVKNDDVGVIRRIPMQMTRAAKRTLYKFVLDFLSTNPVITDGNAVFYAGGNNLGTAALDKIAYAARRLAMMAHVEPGSNEKMDLEPAHIWVPDQLEEVAFDMFVRNTNLDPDFVQKVRAIVHRVWYWTDANNWYLSADKHESPPIEIGFLDGQEEPELFVQDSPTQGSLFSNDVITYKLRHIYGGTVKNREALDGNVVA
ncbi:MAG: hypothetical protein KZQ94_21275, partial [Candidatus Thiodiazotropha sp. (ex Troendleina suluensis)]|nr:hypothetical protein [Candidatus Thiodiazotropha sp. (ex Troendleina suluensis)]